MGKPRNIIIVTLSEPEVKLEDYGQVLGPIRHTITQVINPEIIRALAVQYECF
jgi:hypothetical protein